MYGPLKGIVDFYYWKSLLCARAYPVKVKQPGTEKQKLTWKALASKWLYARLITRSDQVAYKAMGGSSDMSWIDVYSKAYMQGYYALHRAPPVLYDSVLEQDNVNHCISFSVTEMTNAMLCVSDFPDNTNRKAWYWKPVYDRPVPPNFRPKLRLLESWQRQYKIEYDSRLGRFRICIKNPDQGFYRWISVVVYGGKDETIISRLGVYRIST